MRRKKLNDLLDAFDEAPEAPDGVDLLDIDLPEGLEDEVPVSGKIEEDTLAEANTILRQMKALAQRGESQYDLATDFDYYINIVFLSREQRDAFLRAVGWDRYGQRYVNGLALAKALGVELPPVDYRPYEPHPDKKLAEV